MKLSYQKKGELIVVMGYPYINPNINPILDPKNYPFIASIFGEDTILNDSKQNTKERLDLFEKQLEHKKPNERELFKKLLEDKPTNEKNFFKTIIQKTERGFKNTIIINKLYKELLFRNKVSKKELNDYYEYVEQFEILREKTKDQSLINQILMTHQEKKEKHANNKKFVGCCGELTSLIEHYVIKHMKKKQY